jgi:hypothetical protein
MKIRNLKFEIPKTGQLLALAFMLLLVEGLLCVAFGDPAATSRYPVYTTGTSVLSGSGTVLSATGGAVINATTAQSATTSTVSGTASNLSAGAAGPADALTVSGTTLADWASQWGAITWPLVSTDGNLSFGSEAGTQGWIDDNGVGSFQGLASGTSVLGQPSYFVGNNSSNPVLCFVAPNGDYGGSKLIIQSESYGYSEVQMGNPEDNECSWTFLTGVSQFGNPPSFSGEKTSMGLGAYGEFTSMWVFGSDAYGGPYFTCNTHTGAAYVGRGTDTGSGGMLQVNGPYEFNDDSTTPTNTSTPAGWIHFKRVDGSDAWFPYYQ